MCGACKMMRKSVHTAQIHPRSGRIGGVFVSGYCFAGETAQPSLMAACAAARRAMGTRKGEQDT